jgi:hypothetical protein
LTFLPSGSASNEALHNEANSFFEHLVNVHPATVEQKARLFKTTKLLSHNAALYQPTIGQVRQADVLNRVISVMSPWEVVNSWETWCHELNQDEYEDPAYPSKAKLKLADQRAEEADAVRVWKLQQKRAGRVVSKRPANAGDMDSDNLPLVDLTPRYKARAFCLRSPSPL